MAEAKKEQTNKTGKMRRKLSGVVISNKMAKTLAQKLVVS